MEMNLVTPVISKGISFVVSRDVIGKFILSIFVQSNLFSQLNKYRTVSLLVSTLFKRVKLCSVTGTVYKFFHLNKVFDTFIKIRIVNEPVGGWDF